MIKAEIIAACREAGLQEIRKDKYERIWLGKSQLYKVRVMVGFLSADIVLLSCPRGYGANEDEWRGLNMGNLQSANQLKLLDAWLNTYCCRSKEDEPT